MPMVLSAPVHLSMPAETVVETAARTQEHRLAVEHLQA
jgi:hypothetical protein